LIVQIINTTNNYQFVIERMKDNAIFYLLNTYPIDIDISALT